MSNQPLGSNHYTLAKCISYLACKVRIRLIEMRLRHEDRCPEATTARVVDAARKRMVLEMKENDQI